MNKILKFIYTEIAYNGHMQTIGSLFKSIFAAQLFAIKITWSFSIIVYLSLYLIYIYNRYKEMGIDRLTNIIRTEHLKKFDKYIPSIIFIIILSLIIFLYFFSTIKFSIFLGVAIILGLLYTDYFKGLTKKIPMFKNYYVASTFAISIFFPFLYYDKPIQPVLAGVFGIAFFAFLRGIHMQIILDLKDIEGDGQCGLLTLGVIYGKEKVLNFLKYSSIISAGIIPILIYLFLGLTPAVLILPVLIIFDFYIIYLIKKGSFNAYVLESGEFIFWSILVVVAEGFMNFIK